MIDSRALAIVALICACHAEAVKPASQHHVHGVVHDNSGRPLERSVSVTVTDLASRREVAVLRTDPQGRFVLDNTPGDYAFAVTSETGFSYVAKMSIPARELTIKLLPACQPFRGRVTGTIVLPADVSLSRVSKDVGDRFVSAIAADGEFVACLPNGTYSTHVEGAMVSLDSSIRIPAVAGIEISGYAISMVERPPAGIHIGNADLESFVQSLRTSRVVGLGEANHGTGDFYTYRGRLSLELARSGNLRSVLIEADAIQMLEIDDYVRGGDVDILKAVANIGFWITDIREFLAFLSDVRTYNSTVSPARRLHVLGIDTQDLEPPVRYLLVRRSALAISENEAALLERIMPAHGAAYLALSGEDSFVLSSLLGRLAASGIPRDLAADATRASVAARSIRSQLGYVGKASVGGLRDLAMAELAAYFIELGGNAQGTVWAHDGHIARQSDGPNKSLGQHLSERFGDGYYPIAFLSYRGDGRAWDGAGKIGVIPHQLAPTPTHYVESVIMNSTGFADVAWVRLDTGSGPLQQWLSLPRYVREFGSAYRPGKTQTLRAFPAAIAAVVVIQRATSSTPTPTGVREVKQE